MVSGADVGSVEFCCSGELDAVSFEVDKRFSFDFSSIKIEPERNFRKWCKKFLWVFSISAVIFIIFKLINYFDGNSISYIASASFEG